jgi:2-polyprenyl-3-methyl-5-hydroxy-6-metoxy-1,4-benzoquinol methylase
MRRSGAETIIRQIMLETNLRFVERKTPAATREAEASIGPDLQRTLICHGIISMLVRSLPKNQIPKDQIPMTPTRGLEVGTGYGGPLLSYARLIPQVMWYGVEHPNRQYLKTEGYWQLLKQHACHLEPCDITSQALPFKNESFLFITCCEVLEHLPIEKVLFVIGELYRVLCREGWLIVSSPNQVSLACRIRMLLGKRVFDLPIPLDRAGGTFGHIHLYTAEEFAALAKMLGLQVCDVRYATLHWQHVTAPGLWTTVHYRTMWFFERLVRPITRRLADTWFVVLYKTDQCDRVVRS